MNIQVDWFNAVLFGALVIIGQGLVTYVIFYFRESGKNAATKEDIHEITHLQESAKVEFVRGIERLKSGLFLLTNQKFSLANEERNAIYKLVDSYRNYFHRASKYSTSGYTEEMKEQWKQDVSQAKLEADIAEGRLNLFIDDLYFRELLVTTRTEILKIEGIVERGIHRLLIADSDVDRYKAQTNRSSPFNREEFKRLLAVKSQILERLGQEVFERSKLYFPIQREFFAYLSQRLKHVLLENMTDDDNTGNAIQT